MSSTPPNIFLGDLAEALAKLEPAGDRADETRRRIAALLGFEWREFPEPGEPADPATIESQPQSRPQPREPAAVGPIAAPQSFKPRPKPQPKSKPRAESTSPDDTKWIPSALETRPREEQKLSVEDLFRSAPVLPPDDAATARPIPVDPLFAPRWTRGILISLLATRGDGEIDVERLVEKIADFQPLDRLPRRPWPTMRCGVEVLVDVGEAMTPFVQDQTWLIAKIRRVAGCDRVKVLRFRGSPLRGVVSGTELRSCPWQNPSAGVPILVVSNLGAGPGASASENAPETEWLEFAGRVRRGGCPLVALSPHSNRRFSPRLRRALTIAHWDRATTSGTLRTLIGRAHPVG